MNARRRVAKRKNWPDNLYQKPDGYFWYRNPENGKTKGLGRDRAFAFDEAITANLARSKSKASSLTDWINGAGTKSLRLCATEFEAAYLATHSSPNTVKQMRSSIRFICATDFVDKAINMVSTKDVADYLTETEATRGPRAAIQRRNVLRDIFFDAEAAGLINRGENPVDVTKKAKVKVMRDRLSIEQFIAVRSHASGWLVNAMNLAILSGQARAEISAASFADVRDGHWYCRRGKTGAKIMLSTTLKLAAIGLSLEEVIKQCRGSIVSKFLIHHRRNYGQARAGSPVKMDTISHAFALARDLAEVKPQEGKQPPSFHEIRSLSGRLYKKEYGNAEFVQQLFGHSNKEMTDTYIDPRGSEWTEVSIR